MNQPPRASLGGVIHSYQKYDPQRIPSPYVPAADAVSPAFEHLLAYGDLREFTDEQLARAVRIDPSQIAGLGPSLDALRALLLERKRKILEKYETGRAVQEAALGFRELAERMKPPREIERQYQQAVKREQIRDLERLWYRAGEHRTKFGRQLLQLVERLGAKYQIDELAAKYEFTGRTPLTVPEALQVKEELETIDRLLEQLEEAARSAQLAILDLSELEQFADPEQLEALSRLQKQVEEHLKMLAEQQGLERTRQGYRLTPQAYRLFQGKLLQQIFSDLQPSRTGRHPTPVDREGAIELVSTKPYEFGDSATSIDVAGSLLNALARGEVSAPAGARGAPVKLRPDDLVVHRTRSLPKCATSVLLDMSGSMRYGGLYVNVKRMALALQGLITREYPGDFLQFVEMYTVARLRHASEIAALLPRPVSIFEPVVRLRADLSREEITESVLPQHFTNIQHALQLGRQALANRDTPNKQIILITDGLPTAHFEQHLLYMLYPSDPATEQATLREALLCRRAGIVINVFLLSSWSQSFEDIRFAHRLAEQTQGRVFFTAGKQLDRYVVWDYVARRKQIVG